MRLAILRGATSVAGTDISLETVSSEAEVVTSAMTETTVEGAIPVIATVIVEGAVVAGAAVAAATTIVAEV